MIKIPLTKGETAFIDDSDLALVSRYGKWQVSIQGKNNTNKYAMVTFRTGKDPNGKWLKKAIVMHRLILNPPAGKEVDHIDGNGLNNQRNNLRICESRNQNRYNSQLSTRNTSGIKGVSWSKHAKGWLVKMNCAGKPIRVGCYKDKEEASKIYRIVSKLVHGAFSFPDGHKDCHRPDIKDDGLVVLMVGQQPPEEAG